MLNIEINRSAEQAKKPPHPCTKAGSFECGVARSVIALHVLARSSR